MKRDRTDPRRKRISNPCGSRKMRPIVYLIGAGPGDPGLITVRGLRCLEAADVVLHDHLVHPRLLRYPRQEAEKIDVGLAAPQTLDQEAINYLLVEKAREGKIVARLKWGIHSYSIAVDRKRCSCTSTAFRLKSFPAFRPRSRRRVTPAFRSPTRAPATRSRLCAATKTKAPPRRMWTGRASPASAARWCVTQARASSRRSSRRCSRTGSTRTNRPR